MLLCLEEEKSAEQPNMLVAASQNVNSQINLRFVSKFFCCCCLFGFFFCNPKKILELQVKSGWEGILFIQALIRYINFVPVISE